jgi:osmoprotectant transport system permease protein
MDWLAAHIGDVAQLTVEHVLISVTALAAALALAVPIGVWVHGRPRHQALVAGVTGVLYTLPSLALFALLVPMFGLGMAPAVVGLIGYLQLILMRATIDALDSVPADVREAAVGIGMPAMRILREVDAPLALPVFVGGLRIATVTVIGIATTGAVVDAGGLGELILNGIQRDYPPMVLTGALVVSALALLADRLLVTIERNLVGAAG